METEMKVTTAGITVIPLEATMSKQEAIIDEQKQRASLDTGYKEDEEQVGQQM